MTVISRHARDPNRIRDSVFTRFVMPCLATFWVLYIIFFRVAWAVRLFPLLNFCLTTNRADSVAQSVERWTPCDGSTRPGFKSPGFEARRAPDVYRASWRVWLQLVAGHSQLKPAIGTGRARLCAYVKLSTLNSAIDPELRDRKVEDRANVTSSA